MEDLICEEYFNQHGWNIFMLGMRFQQLGNMSDKMLDQDVIVIEYLNHVFQLRHEIDTYVPNGFF